MQTTILESTVQCTSHIIFFYSEDMIDQHNLHMIQFHHQVAKV